MIVTKGHLANKDKLYLKKHTGSKHNLKKITRITKRKKMEPMWTVEKQCETMSKPKGNKVRHNTFSD